MTPPRGGRLTDLFTLERVYDVLPDGDRLLRYDLRCRWCFALVGDRNDPWLTPHEPGCRVGALIARWRVSADAAVLHEFAVVKGQLDAADGRRPD